MTPRYERESAAFTYYPYVSIISGCYADPEQERAVVTGYLEKAHSVDSTRPRLPDALVADLLAHRLRGEHVTCEVKTLSDVIREQAIERIDLLKVDVEKSEVDVLAGIHPED